MHRIRWTCLATALLLILGQTVWPPPARGTVEASQTKIGVRFDFAKGNLADAGGRAMLYAVALTGGELTPVPHGHEWGLRFPPVCEAAPPDCPRVILESDPLGWLNPETKPVRWGASVLMGPSDVSDGSNVLQKGFFAEESQFKLQVDGDGGRPSCVVAGKTGGAHRSFVALAPSGIADGAWHSVSCERHETALRLLIDGRQVAQTQIPHGLSIVNEMPLRVGGNSVEEHNDQFHGAVDDVFVEIG